MNAISAAFLNTWPGAVISSCGHYRYALTRALKDREPTSIVLWVMLNPSTADATRDDNTIRAITRITRAWGYDGFMVGNLYALRSRDPAALWQVDDPFGPDNRAYLKLMAATATKIVAAWGTHAKRADAEPITDMLSTFGEVKCLGMNVNGSPKHPLFIPTDVTPIMFMPARRVA